MKPFDADTARALASSAQRVITLEEHSMVGGLSSVMAESIAGTFRGQLMRFGTQDRFVKLCGSYNFLRKQHGLDTESILEQIRAGIASL